MNHDATTETRLLQSALLADPEAVARWLLYTSDGTYVCVLRKSGKGKPAWHDHDDKRGWADSRGFNPFGLAAAQRAYPALLGLARQQFLAESTETASPEQLRQASTRFAATTKRLMCLKNMRGRRGILAVERAAKRLATLDARPADATTALALLRAAVA